MKLERSTLRDVWDGVRAEPGRIGLSFLAIAIGVASFTMLIGILEGLRTKSQRMVQELGANVVGILKQPTEQKNGGQAGGVLTEKHLALLRANLPGCTISGVNRLSLPTLGGERRITVIATDHSLMEVRQWKKWAGRNLDLVDVQNGQRNAVISRGLSESWNWGLGNVIILGGVPFRVVGIADVGGSPAEAELGDPELMLGERVAFVPRTAGGLVQLRGKEGAALDGIFIRAPNSRQIVDLARRLLSQPGHRIDSVSWVTPDSLLANIRRLKVTIEVTLGGVSILCLILGGTTMMSLMIANVRSRVVEIGLRRSLGATARDIVTLFVVEACVVTVLAGATGMVASHILLLLVRNSFSIPVTLGFASTVFPLFAALILGIAFAYWPARLAAAIEPSEALRND